MSNFTDADFSTIAKFIVEVEGVLADDVCDLIVDEYAYSEDWKAATVSKNVVVDTSVRHVNTIGLSRKETIARNPEVRSYIDTKVFEAAKIAINSYASKFPTINIQQDSGYDLLRYQTGQFYKQHVDSFKQIPREVSCSFALNEDYEGGEFAFFDQRLKYRAKKGSVLMFPSNFMFPHEILTVTSGTRYSIITWFI